MHLKEATPVFRELIQTIERHGIATEGIYRISGVKSHTDELRKTLSDPSISQMGKSAALKSVSNVHTLTATLKQLLRELSPSLVPPTEYKNMIAAVSGGESAVASVLKTLPKEHINLLKLLKQHLSRVAAAEKVNKMTRQNLALMFGPNWMRSPMGQIGDLNDAGGQAQIANMILAAEPGSSIYQALGFEVSAPVSPSKFERRSSYPSPKQAQHTAPKIPRIEKFELEDAFSLLDQDKDGYLSEPDFIELIRGLGYVVASSRLKEVFAGTDRDRDGKVDCMQIQSLAMPLLKENRLKSAQKNAIAEPFAYFDKGDFGSLSKDELMYLLRSYGGNDEFEQNEVSEHSVDLPTSQSLTGRIQAIQLVDELNIGSDGIEFAALKEALKHGIA